MLMILPAKRVSFLGYKYSKIPIYRELLGKGDIRGKSGFAGNRDLVNRGFTVFTAFNDFGPRINFIDD